MKKSPRGVASMSRWTIAAYLKLYLENRGNQKSLLKGLIIDDQKHLNYNIPMN